jgi:hypothetical protein
VTAAVDAPAALEQLAVALGGQFSTILVCQAGWRPCLAVVDRLSRATTEVCADEGGRFWWPWAEPAAVTDDPLTAACRVTAALRPGGPAAGGL